MVDQSDRLNPAAILDLLPFLDPAQPALAAIPRSYPDAVYPAVIGHDRAVRFDVDKLQVWHVAFAVVAEQEDFLRPVPAIARGGLKTVRCDQDSLGLFEGLAARAQGLSFPPYLWESDVVPCQDCRDEGKQCLIPPAKFVLEDCDAEFGIRDVPLQCLACVAGDELCRVDRNLPMTLRSMAQWAGLLRRRREAQEAEEAQRARTLLAEQREIAAEARRRLFEQERFRRSRLEKEETDRKTRESRARIAADRRERYRAQDELRRLHEREVEQRYREEQERLASLAGETMEARDREDLATSVGPRTDSPKTPCPRSRRYSVDRRPDHHIVKRQVPLRRINGSSRIETDTELPDITVRLGDHAGRSAPSVVAGISPSDEAIIRLCASLPVAVSRMEPFTTGLDGNSDDSDDEAITRPAHNRARFRLPHSVSPSPDGILHAEDTYRSSPVSDLGSCPYRTLVAPASQSATRALAPTQGLGTAADTSADPRGIQGARRPRRDKLVPYVEIPTLSLVHSTRKRS